MLYFKHLSKFNIIGMNFGIKILLVANRDPITDPLVEDLDRQNHVIPI
jgi:hypothetical protein